RGVKGSENPLGTTMPFAIILRECEKCRLADAPTLASGALAMPLPYTINTYSYIMSHTAEACLGELAEVGFTQFELMMYPGHAWPAEWGARRRREFRSFLERDGLRVVSLNQPNIDINLAGATSEMRRYSTAIVRSVLQLAGDLGVPGVVVGPGKENPLFRPPRQRLIDLFHRALDELAPV